MVRADRPPFVPVSRWAGYRGLRQYPNGFGFYGCGGVMVAGLGRVKDLGKCGEGGIACATRAFVVTLMSILPGLLIGVMAGLRLAAQRDRKNIAR